MNASEVLNMIFKQLSVPPIGTNCYIFGDDAAKLGAIVDPGGDAAGILSAVRDLGLTVSAIFLTHGHYDHTGAVADIVAAYPGIPVYIHSADAQSDKQGIFPPLPRENLRFYGEGARVPLGSLTGEVLHTPGHPKGSVTLKVEDVLFTGDTLFRGSCGRTDLPGGSYQEMSASLARLGALPGDYRVCPGHEGLSTLETERKINFFLKEAMVG